MKSQLLANEALLKHQLRTVEKDNVKLLKMRTAEVRYFMCYNSISR